MEGRKLKKTENTSVNIYLDILEWNLILEKYQTEIKSRVFLFTIK